ncbi:hypothetical protein [Glutamicibacter nicotianae]|nr:hypothetical protein [Glutamicibacter nicotianae]
MQHHHLKEYCFNALKEWRAATTRYDKFALTYHAAVVMHAVVVWWSALSE